MSTNRRRIEVPATKSLATWGLLALGLALPAGCEPDGTLPLAEMRNKQLHINGLPGAGGFLGVSLFADGCPLLRNDVLATLNDRPMLVSPGEHGYGFGAGPCYQPLFEMRMLPADLGPTLTLVIRDESQTLRAVIESYVDEKPALEEPGPVREIARGALVAIPFGPTTRAPDRVSGSIYIDRSTGGAPCTFSARIEPTVVDRTVQVRVPEVLCHGTGTLGVCLGYAEQPRVAACENAQCNLSLRSTQTCRSYPITLGS
jgi:hypothetical protein